MVETPLHAIIEALQAGIAEEENYRLLFNRYYEKLMRFFLRPGRTVEDCRDLIQETFLGIYRGMATFQGKSTFETWLYSIAANVERKRWRDQAAGKRSAIEVPLDAGRGAPGDEVGETLASSDPRPDQRALTRERSLRLRRAAARLPVQMRRCLLLRIDQELKYREIGAVMRLSIGTVKSNLSEAHTRLQAELGAEFAAAVPSGSEDGP
jgi:RNA polymerase sigma-70 factor (ECF subfamily)